MPTPQHRNEAFRQAIEAKLAAAGENQEKLRAIARVLIERATRGDVAAIHELANRIDRMPKRLLRRAALL